MAKLFALEMPPFCQLDLYMNIYEKYGLNSSSDKKFNLVE